MGDRYFFNLNCAYCKHDNIVAYGIAYSTDWREMFKCEKCKKTNLIIISFKAKKLHEKKTKKKKNT